MSSFFEKLKKGMGVDTPSSAKSSLSRRPATGKAEGKEKTEPTPKPKKEKIKKIEKVTERKVAAPEGGAAFSEASLAPSEREPYPESSGREENKEVKKPMEQEKEKVKIESKPASKWASFSKDQEGQLAIDVYQTEEFLVLQSAIAGIRPENLDIVIEGDMVSIKGNREKPEEKGDRNYFYQECFWGPFSRQIILSVEVDPARAEAALKEGILTIRLPKIERDKKRKLVVKEEI